MGPYLPGRPIAEACPNDRCYVQTSTMRANQFKDTTPPSQLNQEYRKQADSHPRQYQSQSPLRGDLTPHRSLYLAQPSADLGHELHGDEIA
jgi:hypothetical protein